MMRRYLDLLYRGSGALAAMFVAAIATVTLAQVAANAYNAGSKWLFGQPGVLLVPSYAEFGGFFLASASFLALAYTLRVGGHIRVSLVIRHLGGAPRRWVELWCISAGAIVAGYFTWYMTSLMFESIEFGDLSIGMIPVPLWIPQLSMVLGLAILTIAFIDEFFHTLAGGEPVYAASEGKDLTEQTLEGD